MVGLKAGARAQNAGVGRTSTGLPRCGRSLLLLSASGEAGPRIEHPWIVTTPSVTAATTTAATVSAATGRVEVEPGNVRGRRTWVTVAGAGATTRGRSTFPADLRHDAVTAGP